MTRITLSLSLAAAAALALAACGGILPAPAPPPALYHFNAAADFPPPGRTIPVQLLVAAPLADSALDTQRIALARGPTVLDYYADVAWTDRLGVAIQSRLIESLENSHRFAAVGAETGMLRADALLVTELRHFEAVYDGGGLPSWRIEVAAKLVQMPDRMVVAVQDFQGQQAAARNDVPAVVDAADTAWRGVARQIADWCASTLASVPRQASGAR